ncbi:MAG: hypothetical protein ABEJ61_09990 [Haloferacaceae archaeon]
MATDAPNEPAPTGRSLRRTLAAATELLACGLVAAVGLLAVVAGVRRYLEYVDGGVTYAVPYLVGDVALLGAGCTLLLAALSGAVARGVQRGNRL